VAQKTIKLTMAQALVRFLARQMTEIDDKRLPIFGGMWAIFGHGNVAGIGEALYSVRDELPTFRAHNELGMALAAIGYAKASFRRRMMACTSSIGPGATNMVTAAAVAHVNRLPILLLPGDVFANRAPDPVLQQVENFGDGTTSANDCLRPVSRYFDRITRPEQIIPALRRAMQVLTDTSECGPVTLALCQDVQTEAFDYPEDFFAERVWLPRRPAPDASELAVSLAAIKSATRPMIVAGGGVLYSDASQELGNFAQRHGVPVAETQAGKSSLPDTHPLNMGAIGVTGTSASNRLAENADLVLAVGTRLQDFTTGSRSLFQNPDVKIIGLNVQAFDAGKHASLPLVADARIGLERLSEELADWGAPAVWSKDAKSGKAVWQLEASRVTAPTNTEFPSDAQVIGAVQRTVGEQTTLVCAAGGLPGELHKLWHAGAPGSYHLEYGYSCMGYEIAGGLGVKLARPDENVVVMVGDGSYMMLNSELATSVMLGTKLTIVVLDNRGFGCINRLQMATGGANFNNLFKDTHHEVLPEIDFAAHARSMGAEAIKVSSITELEIALANTRNHDRTSVVVIETDPLVATEAGGHWWDVSVPAIGPRAEAKKVRAEYETARKSQRIL
jgi:3D-(3,5/4)-trihydroxycyclohexane-1,2-dione acylhydrolase (decyclizing)